MPVLISLNSAEVFKHGDDEQVVGLGFPLAELALRFRGKVNFVF